MFKKIGRVFGLKEKVFIPEILRGLYVTNKHFWQNIFSPLTKRSFTVQYPEVTRAIAPR